MPRLNLESKISRFGLVLASQGYKSGSLPDFCSGSAWVCFSCKIMQEWWKYTEKCSKFTAAKLDSQIPKAFKPAKVIVQDAVEKLFLFLYFLDHLSGKFVDNEKACGQ